MYLDDLVEILIPLSISLHHQKSIQKYNSALFCSFQIGLELSEACAKLNFASFRTEKNYHLKGKQIVKKELLLLLFCSKNNDDLCQQLLKLTNCLKMFEK